jgi:hypothetical protein
MLKKIKKVSIILIIFLNKNINILGVNRKSIINRVGTINLITTMNTITIKKRLFTAFIVTMLTLFSCAVFGQEKSKNETNYKSKVITTFIEGNYQVKIITLPSKVGYGYEIFALEELLVSQLSKPYFEEPSLFSNIGNAIIIAKYHVANLNTNDTGKLIIDLAKAKTLGVSNEDLIINK